MLIVAVLIIIFLSATQEYSWVLHDNSNFYAIAFIIILLCIAIILTMRDED